jgi:hypothetical protein
VDEEHDQGGAEDDERGDKTEELEGAADVVESAGKLSLGFAGVEFGIFDATGRVLANAADEGLADAASDEGISVEEGVALGVLGNAFVKLGTVELLSLLSRDGLRLSNGEVGRGEDEAVGGDFIARLKLDDVTNNEVPD